jgi:glyoxylate/hydroxypyruvate reductase A
MTEFVVFQVLDLLRQGRGLRQAQRNGEWLDPPIADPGRMSVGVLGLGTLGADVARRLIVLGFPLKGWSRSAKSVPGVTGFAGDGGLSAFLADLKILICLLPLTASTEGILNVALFDRLPMGSILMNVGRGGHLVGRDLLAALDNGRLSLAMLDVFREEPLPPDHIFWRRKDIIITPHVAAITRPGTGAADILENYRRAMAGEPLLNIVDQGRGY